MTRPSLLPIVALVAATALTACVAPTLPRESRQASFTLPAEIRVRTAGRIVEPRLDDYVLGTALSEVSPVGETPETTRRIFEVQAILARTYAVAHLGRHHDDGFDLCDSTHCQLYEPQRIGTSRFTAVARQAVADTEGQVLFFDDHPAEALFHADCGGHTASADDVWGGAPVPYLLGAPDDEPAGTHRVWHADLSVNQIRTALNKDVRSDVGRRLDAIAIVEEDASGRAENIEVRGERTHRLRGDDFRRILNQTFGDHMLQSTKFSVSRKGSSYRFDGSGFGHGVGLCQVGAAARARRGESVAEILAAYFPGVRIVRAESSAR